MKVLVSVALFVSVLGFTGCKQESVTPTVTGPAATSPADGSAVEPKHEGHGAGPHEGTVADWGGGKYHVEFIVDHNKQEGTVYVLGADEKTPTPIAAESIELSITDPMIQVTLKAAPQASDPAGTASRFVGNHEKLGVVREYAGTITGVIEDTPYTGEFKEEPHVE